MAGIEIEVDDVDAGTIRDQVAPVLALGRSQWCGDDLEVGGVVGIGEDEELVAAVGLWLATPWGAVVWLTTVVSMAVIELMFPGIYGGSLTVVGVEAAMLAERKARSSRTRLESSVALPVMN